MVIQQEAMCCCWARRVLAPYHVWESTDQPRAHKAQDTSAHQSDHLQIRLTRGLHKLGADSVSFVSFDFFQKVIRFYTGSLQAYLTTFFTKPCTLNF